MTIAYGSYRRLRPVVCRVAFRINRVLVTDPEGFQQNLTDAIGTLKQLGVCPWQLISLTRFRPGVKFRQKLVRHPIRL